MFLSELARAQERISVQDGPWNASSTWSDDIIPSMSNSSSVTIAHQVTISAGDSISIAALVVGGDLTVDSGAELHIVNGDSVDLILAPEGALDVYGMLVGHDSVAFGGMTATNTRFHAGSVYRHLASKEGNIPVAQWDPNSTFEIRGLVRNPSMKSPNWGQAFGNVLYDCPDQGVFVEFDGHLRMIAGDLIVSNTNGNTFRLSRSDASDLEVSGDIVIKGNSRVSFSTTGNCTVSVGGDLQFMSTTGSASYFTTTGHANVTINGDLVLDGTPSLRMGSSTSTGHTDLFLRGNVHLLNGTLDALDTGSGTIIFDGLQPQHVFSSPGTDTFFEGNISYRVAPHSDVDLHQSLITNTTNGDLVVEGTLRLGSVNQTGIIQAGEGGNIQVNGSIYFSENSSVIFNGTQVQHVIYPDLRTHVVFDNPAGVVLPGDVQFGSVLIRQGHISGGDNTIGITGDLAGEGTGRVSLGGTLLLNGSGEQAIDIRGDTLFQVIVAQEPPGKVRLASTLCVSGSLAIQSAGSDVISDGNLVLLSSSEMPGGTASVATLPPGSAVVGAVTVQRFIQGEPGDKYRYISAPVANATVGMLMDDVPVTGTFDDADTGSGLPEGVPSLFRYREEVAEWEPFPSSGTSGTNYFKPGRGYSFFNWNEAIDTKWDVTGVINQGPITFELTYTQAGDTALTGWNLVGNPYPATIKWGEQGWIPDSVSAGIAVRDNLSGGFRYWDGETGSLAGGLIASGQAFWVRTVGPDPSLQIDENAKTNAGAEYYRKRFPDYFELTLGVEAQEDKAYFRIRDGSTGNLDRFDAPKLRNDSLSLSFRTSDSLKVAIDAVPRLPCHAEIPIDIEGIHGAHELHFKILAEGLFRTAAFVIVDTIAEQRYGFDKEGRATIAGDMHLPALRLVVESGTPVATTASAPDVVYAGDTLAVALEGGPREGVSFYLEHAGEQFWPLPGSRAGSLYFLADSLPSGRNVYALMGGSACSGPSFIDSIAVLKQLVPEAIVTGLIDMGEGESITAFPIPCRKFLHVRYAGDHPLIQVCTIEGRLIRMADIHREEGGYRIDLSRVSPGNYFVRVMGKSNHAIIRIVKVE